MSCGLPSQNSTSIIWTLFETSSPSSRPQQVFALLSSLDTRSSTSKSAGTGKPFPTFANISTLFATSRTLRPLTPSFLTIRCCSSSVSGLWLDVARCTNATMKFEVEYYRNTGISSLHSRFGYDETTDTSTWPDILVQLRQYQAQCAKHGVSLRVTKKEMISWIVDSKTTFAIKLPTIPQDVQAKTLGDTSQESSSD
jgi:hypothetical protein